MYLKCTKIAINNGRTTDTAISAQRINPIQLY